MVISVDPFSLLDGLFSVVNPADFFVLTLSEHKDRLTCTGFRYLETLFGTRGRSIEVVNVAENDQGDLIANLVAIVYSFTAKRYGQRRAKQKTERLVQELQSEEKEEG